jgi:hypothetical protein
VIQGGAFWFRQNGKAEFARLLRIGKDGTFNFANDEGTVLMPCLPC